MINTEQIESARRRNGRAKEDRPTAAEDALEDDGQKVGYGVAKPLLERPYEDYPSDVLVPSSKDALSAVVAHDCVGSIEDAAAELDTTVSSKIFTWNNDSID